MLLVLTLRDFKITLSIVSLNIESFIVWMETYFVSCRSIPRRINTPFRIEPTHSPSGMTLWTTLLHTDWYCRIIHFLQDNSHALVTDEKFLPYLNFSFHFSLVYWMGCIESRPIDKVKATPGFLDSGNICNDSTSASDSSARQRSQWDRCRNRVLGSNEISRMNVVSSTSLPLSHN